VEGRICAEVPGVTAVLTHIESEPATIEFGEHTDGDRQLTDQLRNTSHDFPEIRDVHDIVVAHAHGPSEGIQINCHCTLADDLPMSKVHSVISEFERSFRQNHPRVARVFIHPEPITDNQR
jgi:divalent metal cation (Fe/Co/Zn/Cd) transporter